MCGGERCFPPPRKLRVIISPLPLLLFTKREQNPKQSEIDKCDFTRKDYELVKGSFGLTSAAAIHSFDKSGQ